MKNIFLTEDQFKTLIENNIFESISFNEAKGEDDSKEKTVSFANKNVGRITKYLSDVYGSEDDERKEQRDNLKRLAGINNVNFDFSQEEYDERFKEILKHKNEVIKEWVRKYLPILRRCWIGRSFTKSKEVARYNKETNSIYNTNTSVNREGSYESLDDETKSNVINLASFLDKNRLTCIYREFQKQPSVTFACGIDIREDDVNCKTPVDKLVNKMNFSGVGVTEDELLAMYDGTRVKAINQELGFNDERRHTKDKDKEGWEKVKEVAATKIAERKAKLYLDSTYGMELKFGDENKMFKYGNTKVPNDTLVVNFASAIRCPAWNECIMKDACYAKTSEIMYDNTFNSNLKKNLIWEQTRIDKKLMSLMMSLLRSYLLDYSSLPVFKTMKRGDEKNELMWEMCQKPLYEIQEKYGNEYIDILKENKYGSLIRLNENGDFIGQWLVDAFEQFAEELKLVEINIAAYTCRALNYESVKNMILNISQQALVANQKSSAFAHYFYAISPRDYAKLGETYGGPDFTMDINPNTKKITPIYRKLIDENGVLKGYYYKCPCGRGKYKYVKVNTEGNDSLRFFIVNGVKYNPKEQRFDGVVDINGKEIDGKLIGGRNCACKFIYDAKTNSAYYRIGTSTRWYIITDDNDDFDYGKTLPTTILSSNSKYFLCTEDGCVYKKSEISSSEKSNVADCYMCRICYARDAEGGVKYEGGKKEDVPVYVFVATHGANKNEFQNPNGRKIAGKSAGEWADILNERSNPISISENAFNEDESVEEQPQNDDLAIKTVVNNFVDSVATRMRDRNNQINEIKSNFNSFLEKING